MKKTSRKNSDASIRPEYEDTPKRQRPAMMLQFLITLLGTQPLIWRRVVVPDGYTYWDLHVAIQDAMGWADRHLHEFNVVASRGSRQLRIGIPTDDDLPGSKDVVAGWDTELSLSPAPPGLPMRYVYDFGDAWEHVVVWEGYFKARPGPEARRPRCIAGERACPPEDCGGIPGFESFLEAIADPSHPEHQQMREWVGDKYDPVAFDPTRVRFDDPEERWQRAFGEGSR